jgi:hypothetical protein
LNPFAKARSSLPMHLRIPSLLIAALLLSLQSSFAATSPDVPMPKGVLAVTAVYLAKGPPDSCGSGCDRWIAVEGKMDKAAAARVRSFFRKQKTSKLPIYLHSPGGDVRQALAIGRMLRERKATARVARTMVKECGPDGQAEPACLKLKQSGRELESELTATSAFCNSACTYLLFGATTREVDPDVTLGVHSARVTMSYHGGRAPPLAVRELAARRAVERLNRDLADYLVAMGIDRGLQDLVKTVKFEQMHALRWDELVRFGIDKRELVETNWRFNDRGTRSYVDKIVQARTAADPKAFRTQHWRLSCLNAPHMRLDYVRVSTGEALASVVLRFGADQKIVLVAAGTAPLGEMRSVRVESGMVEKLKAAAQISLMEVGKVPDTNKTEPPVRETILSTDGLSRSIDQLSLGCRL